MTASGWSQDDGLNTDPDSSDSSDTNSTNTLDLGGDSSDTGPLSGNVTAETENEFGTLSGNENGTLFGNENGTCAMWDWNSNNGEYECMDNGGDSLRFASYMMVLIVVLISLLS